jgi:hypothetical protein
MIEDRYKESQSGADHYTLGCNTLDELFIEAEKRGENLQIELSFGKVELTLDDELLAYIDLAKEVENSAVSASLIADMHRFIHERQREQGAEIEPSLSASDRN